MPVLFDENVFSNIKTVKHIVPQSQELWVPIELKSFLKHKGSFVQLQKVTVKTSSSKLHLAWNVTWNSASMLPTLSQESTALGGDATIGAVGFSNLDEGWNVEDLPKQFRKNVEEFVYSSLETSFTEAKKEFSPGKHLELTETFYLNDMKKEGGITCLMLSGKDEEESNSPLLVFMVHLLQNQSMTKLLSYFSEPYYDKLFRYGLDMITDSFPFMVSVRISKCAPNELVKVIPFEAIQKVMLVLQEIEQTSYIYYVPEKETCAPKINVLVPANVSMKILVTVQLVHGTQFSRHDTDRVEEEEEEEEEEMYFGDLDPSVMAKLHRFSLRSTEEELETILKVGRITKKNTILKS